MSSVVRSDCFTLLLSSEVVPDELYIKVFCLCKIQISKYYPLQSGWNSVLGFLGIHTSDGNERSVFGKLQCQDVNVFCQCNSSSRRSGWSCSDGVMSITSPRFHQAVAFGEQLAAAQLFLCIFFTCPLTMKSWQPTAPSLLLWVCWQPLDGGISPGFFFLPIFKHISWHSLDQYDFVQNTNICKAYSIF